jgi:F0F1-type ATP synthase membrane subunit b/b'
MNILVNTIHLLGLDQTVFYQFFLTVVGIPAVAYFLIYPLFKFYNKREELTVGYRDRAQQVAGEAQQLAGQYESQIGDIQTRAQVVLEQKLAQGQDDVKKALKAARDQADVSVAEIRKATEKDVHRLREHLRGEMDILVNQIVERLS